ncbi:MAG: glycine--tRNA ligase [Candidatus Pacebacteria bacterium]|nr:glycine--tRNA ligase [Candidatus Paceibacterota bacterium]MDD3729231.1 glycine--tRNA ligase [Candidatus Paceibacterota bacterium]MDD4201701.1 glycine--tRNA ligase [Candidatus Paceibacterota bacterium]MDD5446003.1 glycine--tRNA ligase [Candidatus Paceibacterota bacterium]
MENLFSKIISFCKRRGFVFPSSQIYGGFSSSYDFGPLGAEMKKNIKEIWWKEMTRKEKNIVGIDSAILMNPKVWEASGHLTSGFADELVECKKCHRRFRKDFLEKDNCPECKGELTKPRKFNLMLKTFIGPVETEASVAYLRAETCQGIYVNFQNVLQSMRLKVPFGIAQIGKAFRNEITPKDFIFRTREFEQMEMQWFCKKEDADSFFEYFKEKRLNWYYDLGIRKENIRLREQEKEELAHYAKRAVDIEYKFPFGWKEIEGIHNRGNFDLSNHSKHSKEDLSFLDEETKEKFVPDIIETSVGVERSLLAFLCNGYNEVEEGRSNQGKTKEIILSLHPSLSPIKAAVLPLVKNKPEIREKAKEVYSMLKSHFAVSYDETGSIGRRYRRQDEIGTPFAVTIDFETINDNCATIRNSETMKQERIKIDKILYFLKDNLEK